MKILVQIAESINGYINNVAAAYRRVEIKGNLPPALAEKFRRQLNELAVTADEIKEHVNTIPEP